MRILRPRAQFTRTGCLVAAFLFGCLLTYALRSTSNRAWCQAPIPVADVDPDTENLLLVLILSAPSNLELRTVIRTTWLPLATQIPAPLDARLRTAISTPRFNDAGFVAGEPTDTQAENLRRQRDALPKRPRMRREEHFVPVHVQHRFVIGTAGMSRMQQNQLAHEQREHGDLLLLDGLLDNYRNLTAKLLQAFDAVVYGGWPNIGAFRYVLKCDDDTYVKLDLLVADLLVYDELVRATSYANDVRPELYWGYFRSNAEVKKVGKWREENYVLADRYHPYALGGGYVVSSGIVRWVAANAPQLVAFVSEDVSVGLWLSAVRTVYRRHDVRFDTAWLQRECREHHFVLHKRSVRDMKMVRGGGVCSGVEPDGGGAPPIKRPTEYFYNWTLPASRCCGRRVVV